MAEITVVEKAPGYRLDHPDFGVVCRVSYAKGVITEVKTLQDDPLKMASQAKVKVADEESDFIPIFFCPKKQYWDTEDHEAQDINQDEKLYENAWMSFRGDDEVKVMLCDGKAFAVIGFLDGVPRIGEDIINIYAEEGNGTGHKVSIQCSKKGQQYGEVDAGEIGPDGLNLGLKKEGTLICQAHKEITTFLGYYDFVGAPWDGESSDESNKWYSLTRYDDSYYYEWLIQVGSIMFIFQCYSNSTRILTINYINPHLPYEPGFSDPMGYTAPFSVLAAPYKKDVYDAAISTGEGHSGLDPDDIDEGWQEVGSRGYWLDYPGFTYQEDFTMNIVNNDNLNHQSYWDDHSFDITKFVLKIRPHTKEELQAAGMWPGSE